MIATLKVPEVTFILGLHTLQTGAAVDGDGCVVGLDEPLVGGVALVVTASCTGVVGEVAIVVTASCTGVVGEVAIVVGVVVAAAASVSLTHRPCLS